MTLHAVALIENCKGALVYSYSQAVEPDAAGAETRATRDEKLIRQMLSKMENREFENQDDAADYKNKFAGFKVLVNKFLAEPKDERILVVIGASHVKLLQQFAVESGDFELESANKYLQ